MNERVDAIREMYHAQGLSLQEIARNLGISRQRVLQIMQAAEVARRPVGRHLAKPLPLPEHDLAARYLAGSNFAKLAALCGISPQTMARRLSKLGITRQTRITIRRLNARELRKKAFTEVEIARALSCSQNTISKTLAGTDGAGYCVRQRGRPLKSLPMSDEEIARALSGGQSIRVLARRNNCSVETVRDRRKRANIQPHEVLEVVV